MSSNIAKGIQADGGDFRENSPSRASFTINRDRVWLTFLGVFVSFALPIDLLVWWLSLHVSMSALVLALSLAVAPVVGALYGWQNAITPPRIVHGDEHGVEFTMQSGRVLRIRWPDILRVHFVGLPLRWLRLKSDELPTRYGVIFLTVAQARALVSHPSFPELYGLHEVRARLGITS